jgi:hypothetical protein
MEITPLGSSNSREFGARNRKHACDTIIASHSFNLSFPPPIIHPSPNPPPELLGDMLIVFPVAGALLFHNALASTIGDRSSPQVVFSGHDSPTAIPDNLEEVDISEGWADPRINGGRFLDVCLILVNIFHVILTTLGRTTVHRTAPRRASQHNPLGAI